MGIIYYFTNNRHIRGQFHNQTPIGWFKKYQIGNKLYYMEQLMHNCINSPHSCHPHLGTCPPVTLDFAVPFQRTAPQICAANFYFIRVESLGSQPEIHLGEKTVSASRPVWNVTGML